MDTLDALDDVVEVDVGASLAEGRIELTFVLEAGDDAQAAKLGSDRLRTAIHAIGGGTPNWPSFQVEGAPVTVVPIPA